MPFGSWMRFGCGMENLRSEGVLISLTDLT
jgi:hypothetical protein